MQYMKHHYMLHALSAIIRVIISRRLSWADYVTRVWQMRKACRVFGGKPRGKRTLEKYKRNGVILLKRALKK